MRRLKGELIMDFTALEPDEQGDVVAAALTHMWRSETLGWASVNLIARMGNRDAPEITERLQECVIHDCSLN